MPIRLVPILAVMLALFADAAEPPANDAAKTNRLVKESSPYLLQHAHNPVDWFPWGPEAFEKAKREKKLIFLSIGYSSCHWCHVMERESFSNAEVAAILNAEFVCIKVDREERPDIDDIYMTALNVIGGQGGWPLSMFLTADGKPIVGGTYWPREDREKDGETVRGFKSILKHMQELRDTKYEALIKQADNVADATRESLNRAARGLALVELDQSLIHGTMEALNEQFDPVHGGFGNPETKFRSTKFPTVTATRFLLDEAYRRKDNEQIGKLTLTLDKMAEGGIFDHLGGGFHRYSTERTWTVPHFEKMLYDQSQLVELYIAAYHHNPKPLYRRTVTETLAFVERELTSPDGAFYSALDADSDGKEGESYLWTGEEIDKLITDKRENALFKATYGTAFNANFEGRAWVLRLQRPLEEIAAEQKLKPDELLQQLASPRAVLLAARQKRPQPFRDSKIITAWNGQMIAAYAIAGAEFQEQKYLDRARKAADFILKHLRDKDGKLRRIWAGNPANATIPGYLDDYAFFVHGLLELHRATHEKRWLDEAIAITEMMIKQFGEVDRGGFYFSSADHAVLFARSKDFHDGAQPAANTVATRNLWQLADLTKTAKYRELAIRSMKQFAGAMKIMPSAMPGMANNLAIVLASEPSPKKEAPPAKSSSDVVKIESALINEGRAIRVKLIIADGLHLYANPPGNDELINAATRIEIYQDGKKLDIKLDYPMGIEIIPKDVKEARYRVYRGTVVLTAPIDPKAEKLQVRLRYQACYDEGGCLLPVTVDIPSK